MKNALRQAQSSVVDFAMSAARVKERATTSREIPQGIVYENAGVLFCELPADFAGTQARRNATVLGETSAEHRQNPLATSVL